LLGLTACGVGITLTAATALVFAELHFTPSILIQAEDRAHRIGQVNPINIYYMVARDTTDDIVLQLLSDKSQIAHEILDSFSYTKEEVKAE